MTAAVPITTQRNAYAGDQGQIGRRADAAPVLHGDVQGLDDAFHDGEVGEVTGAGRVQVHDVESLRALRLPHARELDGVVTEDGGVLERPPRRNRTALPPDVDGRKDDHGRASCRTRLTKVASSARRRWLFSGWNCTAHTLSLATAAATRPP